MTVEQMRDNEEANIAWFDAYGELKRATIRVAALKHKGHKS